MYSRFFTPIIGLVLLLSSCSKYSPEINSVCLRDDIGNYILKWETNPIIEGDIKIYVSDNPDYFKKTSPVIQVPTRNGIATYITNDNIKRKYFLLSFNDKYHQTVSSRAVLMDSVQNLRDMGGYVSNQNEKSTRWGKVFRSGSISTLSARDTMILDNLKIKTIIDLRSDEEVAVAPIVYKKADIVHVPVSFGNLKDVYRRIEKGNIRKGDGLVLMQDTYLQFITESSKQFAKAMEVFLDEENYPILLNCTVGKDRTGFLAAILLLSLDIPEETVVRDYMVTNNYLNLLQYETLLQQIDPEVRENAQEILTVILTANESFLDIALKKIKKDYGSVSQYLTKELNIDEKEQNKLKEILLF